MVPNAKFWTDYFRQAIRELQGFRAGALEKVVPAFEGIAEDAARAAEEEYERLGSLIAEDAARAAEEYERLGLSAIPDALIDMSDVADMAKDHGITVYETMSGVRQGVLNVLAVGLYHLFEQQQLFFLRRELLSREEDVPALFKVAELEKRLDECGVECRSFSCAGKLHELRTAANAIKHGTGPAGDELARLRPDLFGNIDLLQLEGDNAKSSHAAMSPDFITPLAGDDLYVSERDLSEWCDAAIAFWEELSVDDQQRR